MGKVRITGRDIINGLGDEDDVHLRRILERAGVRERDGASGTLTFDPDGEEAEERVVEVVSHDTDFNAGDLVWFDRLHDEDGQNVGLRHGRRYAMRGPLRDEPKPVEVWERPCGGQICSACGFPATTRELGKPCPNANCGKLLAAEATPWRGGRDG